MLATTAKEAVLAMDQKMEDNILFNLLSLTITAFASKCYIRYRAY